MLSKSYSPHEVEERVYAFWESRRLFKPETADDAGNTFSLVIPPPNVTGVLHMGHALDSTIQDILIRWHRMTGDKTLWMPGMDHAGIATQNVVERNLRKEGKTKEELGREAFVETVWEWTHARRADIANQFRKLGVSPDWERQRFTLDEGLSAAVREAFVQLYKKGLIVRGTYIVNWCPRCESAISDIETDYVDEESHLWQIAYPLSDGSGKLVVATTRPETMFGDVAVAVNPEDERYREFIGKTVMLPLANREIPVIADDYVDMSFGTGALKITPAHDPNDFEIGSRHGLEAIWALDEKGCLKDEAFIPSALRGMDRFDARVKTEELLSAAGQLVSKEEHAHRVGQCQRCSTTIEPLLSKQWFVKTKPLAEACIQAHKAGEIRFIPERWTKEYLRWLNDIQDWCISRQLWWGHQIPAWYCSACDEITVEREDPSVCVHCGSSEIRQDEDVLDTWFSSGLWPFSTMGWPDESATDFKEFYPTDVLVTGFDIIFFWVARMTMFAHELTGKSPFHTVYIHGLIRDEKGQKMSKSKGNTVDPLEAIEKYGCDGFRFGLTSLITYGGQDIKLAPDKLERGKLFANKLWNASRFVLMNLEGVDDNPIDLTQLSAMDRWILSRYHSLIQEVSESLAAYKFGEYADGVCEFTWNHFCDWYVEYAKKQLKEESLKANTQRILRDVLNGIIRLLHPIMPFITEAIWENLPHRQSDSVMVASFPVADRTLVNESLQSQVQFVLDTVRAIRNIRQQYNIAFNTEVSVVIQSADVQERSAVEAGESIIRHFITLSDMAVEADESNRRKQAATSVLGHSRIQVPLEGLIDMDQELERLNKRIQVLKKEQEQLYGMMSNFEFMERAPQAVVQKNKDRLDEVNKQMKVLEVQLQDFA